MGIYDLFAIERIHHQQVLIRRSKRIKLGRLGKVQRITQNPDFPRYDISSMSVTSCVGRARGATLSHHSRLTPTVFAPRQPFVAGRKKAGRWNGQSALGPMCDAEKDWHERSFRASGEINGCQKSPLDKPEMTFSFLILKPPLTTF